MMRSIQKGFTLIELVVVIVILGILAATALPKFVNLSTEAEKASAGGVLGAAQSACAINFAKNRAQGNTSGFITDGASLLTAMSPAPTSWSSATNTITHTGADAATYTITVATVESATTPCLLTKSW